MIKIRSAKESDVEQIYLFGRKINEFAVSSNMKFYYKRELKEWIKKPKENILLVAADSKQIAGFLYAKIISKDWCMLDNVAVREKYRNQGIGTNLIDKLNKILKKKNIEYVHAIVGIEHKKSRKFWNKQKFKESNKFIWIEKFI
jgi:N-acetylglutamate synthase-like GNAT family acetyltransferase